MNTYWLDTTRKVLKVSLAGMFVIVLGQGCTTNIQVNLVREISLMTGQRLETNNDLQFLVRGQGRCGKLHIDWGDGTVLDDEDVSLGGTPYLHRFSGWGGGKTVTVEGVDGCEGKGNTKFTLTPVDWTIGFAQPGTNTCTEVPGKGDLAMRTLVHVTTTPVTGRFAFGIDFGCPLSGCQYNADGKPGSVAPARFPFPGLREFSLVLRVGTQVAQGGTDARFTTTQSGPLEICINDDNLADNEGGYQINIAVDQLGP